MEQCTRASRGDKRRTWSHFYRQEELSRRGAFPQGLHRQTDEHSLAWGQVLGKRSLMNGGKMAYLFFFFKSLGVKEGTRDT